MYICAVVRFLSRCKRSEVVYEQAKCVDFNWAKSSRQKRFLPNIWYQNTANLLNLRKQRLLCYGKWDKRSALRRAIGLFAKKFRGIDKL